MIVPQCAMCRLLCYKDLVLIDSVYSLNANNLLKPVETSSRYLSSRSTDKIVLSLGIS